MAPIPWRHPSKRRGVETAAAAPEDNDDDLRAGLPAQFQDTDGEQIPALWVAWQMARAGHQADYLTQTYHLPAEVAHRLVALAHQKPPHEA